MRVHAFCLSLLALGLALGAAGLALAARVLPDPTVGHLARPLWGVLVAAGGLYAILGAALHALRPRDAQDGELAVGYVLGRAPAPAYALAWAGVVLAGAGGVLALVGVGGAWVELLAPSGEDWTLSVALSAATLFLVGLGALAHAWSLGKGTHARRRLAFRRLVAATLLAFAPWLLRAPFIP